MIKNHSGKFLISVFAVSFLVFGVFHNNAGAGFWDWLKISNNSQQTASTIIVTYKWVNNGLVSESSGKYTGTCAKKQETAYVCNSSNVGSKLYDGTNRGSSYGDVGHAWPIYEGENTSTATEYTYSGCRLDKRTGGQVNEWECKASNTTTTNSSSSNSSVSSYPSNLTVKTNDATNITSNSATLNGEIAPGDGPVIYRFLHVKAGHPETAEASPWKQLNIRNTANRIPISVDISNLSSETSYNFASQVYDPINKTAQRGEVKTFKTSKGSISSSSSSSSFSSSKSSASSAQQYTLNVKIAGAGKITSSGGSGVISCKKSIDSNGKGEVSGDCDVKFNEGESVTLTPSTPNTQYEFAIWADDCRASQSVTSCTIKMNQDRKVSATFNKKGTDGKKTVTVSVRKTGKGDGNVNSLYYGGENSGKEDGKIKCGNNCSETYEQNCQTDSNSNYNCNSVYFKAIEDDDSTFSGWGGDCSGSKDECQVVLDGDKTIIAKFNEGNNNAEGKYYDLTVTVSEGGAVVSTDNKINCNSENSPCEKSYGKNGTVTLTITPNSGYLLSSTGGCTESKSKNSNGSYTCKIKMTKNQKLAVNFKTSGSSSSSSISSSKSFSSSSSRGSSSSYATNLTVKTNDATNITSNSATLNGTINPKGEIVAYRFLYVQSGKRGTAKSTSWSTLRTGVSSDTSVFADVSNLSSKTSYNFALQVYSYTSKKFSPLGGVKTFTSSERPSVSSSSSSQTTASSYNLKVKVSGSGRIQDNYSQIDCGSNSVCEAKYSKGKVITLLTEDRDSNGVSFNTEVDSWSGGGCSGGAPVNACSVTMDEDKEVTVNFISK